MLLYILSILLLVLGALILYFNVKASLYNKDQENSLIGAKKDIRPYVVLRILWFICLLFTLLLFFKRRNVIENGLFDGTTYDNSKKIIDNNRVSINDTSILGNKKNIVIVDDIEKSKIIGDNIEYIPITSGYYEIITDDSTIISKNIANGSYEIPSPVINNYCSKEDKFWNLSSNGINYNGFVYDYLNGKNIKKVVVAVIDSGIDTDNKTLIGHISKNKNEIINGKDDDGDGYIDNLNGVNVELLNGNIDDELGHGTHVAGILLQTFPNAEILPIKVSNDENNTVTEVALVEGIRYAINHHVDIINLSLGSKSATDIEQAIIKEATDKGILVIAAAGNEGKETSFYFPAGYNEVFSIGSIGQDGLISKFSNINATINLPGECIYSYGINLSGVFMDGTSMSSPHLAGIIGAYKSVGNGIGTKNDIITLLNKSTKKIGTSDVIQMPILLGIMNENEQVKKNIGLIESSLLNIKKDLENLEQKELNEKELKTIVGKGDLLFKNVYALSDIYSKLSINAGFGINLKNNVIDYLNLLSDLDKGNLYLTVEGGTLTSSLGVKTCSEYPNCDVFDSIINKGKSLPSSNTVDGFTTIFDNQTEVEFKIYQGDNKVASKNNYLGVVVVSVPPKKAGEVNIKVNFDVDKNGKLNVTAEDQDNPKSKVSAKIIKNVKKDTSVITGENYYKVLGSIKSLLVQTDELLGQIKKFKDDINPFDYIPEKIEGAFLRDENTNDSGTKNTGGIDKFIGNNKDFLCDLSKCEYGKVTNVVDGDTIDLNGIRVRLLGVDTPETVNPEKEVECYGPEATQKMEELVLGKNVCSCKDNISENKDKYGRLLRYIYLDNGDSVNEILLSEGYSKEYSKYDFGLKEKYSIIANDAKTKKIGVYSCNNIEDNQQSSDSLITEVNTMKNDGKNCNIKGNINYNGEKIYHVPGCENYDDTVISTSKGERWFCTEEEAKLAGRRKARNC